MEQMEQIHQNFSVFAQSINEKQLEERNHPPNKIQPIGSHADEMNDYRQQLENQIDGNIDNQTERKMMVEDDDARAETSFKNKNAETFVKSEPTTIAKTKKPKSLSSLMLILPKGPNHEAKEIVDETILNAVFLVKDVKHMYGVKSLFCLGQNNCFREFCVRAMINKWFDRFITLCIIVNSLLLASKDFDEKYNEKFDQTWNSVLDRIDLVFSIVFLIECITKIIAMSFFKHRNAYLSDPWNWLDFFIVVVSLISLTPGLDQSSLKALRTARILRPLRSMSQLKSMRSLLETFFQSIPGLLNVCIFMTFIFTIFAIIGINFFVGSQYQFCRLTETLITDEAGEPYWPRNMDAQWQCLTDDDCSGRPNNLGTDVVAKCGDIYRDYGLDPIKYDSVRENQMINYDITNFNSVVQASLTVFQIITLEGWSQLMYNYQDSVGYATSSIFFTLVIIIGAFTSLNLILASIMHSYLSQEQTKKDRDQIEKNKIQIERFNLILKKSTTDVNLVELNELGRLKTSQTKTQSTPKTVSVGEGLNPNIQYGSDKKEDLFQEEMIPVDPKDDESPREIFENILEESNVSSVQLQDARQDIFEKEVNQQQFHLPNLHGRTQEKFQGILAHQKLEDLDGSIRDSQMSVERGDKDKSIRQSQDAYDCGIKLSPQNSQNNNNSHLDSQNAPLAPILQVKKHQEDESQCEIESPAIIKQERPLPRLSSQDVDVNEKKSSEEEETDGYSEVRAKRNGVYKFFYVVVTSVTFNFVIYCFILINTITLALYRFDQSEAQEQTLKIFEFVLGIIFFFEMVAKLIGLGVKNYARDGFNIFDASLVVVTLIDLSILVTVDSNNESVDSIMSSLRALRFLRVVKLARHWKAFQEILQTMMNSLIDISNFSVLLLLIMFIFALLGMELFAFSVFENAEGDFVYGQENIKAAFESGEPMNWPRENFNNVFSAMLTVFIVIAGEDWNQVMYLYVRALENQGSNGRLIALLYFVLLFVIGNTVMLALFTALLLKSDEETGQKIIEQQAQMKKQSLKNMSTIDLDGDSSVIQRFKKSCSRKELGAKWINFGDSFVKIFGGESAVSKRQQKRKQKDPQSSAFPMIGTVVNQIVPNQQEDAKISSDKVRRQTIKKVADLKNLVKDRLSMKQFLNADVGKKEQEPLQRPSHLLHYDYHQVNILNIIAETEKKKNRTIQGNSLFIFGPKNPIRKVNDSIIHFWLFDNFIILLILVSTLSLAFEHPIEDPNSSKMELLKKIDLFMTLAFCTEALMKIIALGFVANGKDSYLRNSWNVLDICIVATSLISLSIDTDISFIKVLRVARILRPLRLINHAEGLKVAIHALFKAIPQIIRLQVVVVFFLFMISILLTSLLSGRLSRCDTGHTALIDSQSNELIANYWDCISYGGEWITPDMNFDNTLRGMMTLFIFQTTEGWIGLMWDSVDADGVNLVPVRDNSPYYIVFYVILVIILCLLFVNMFIRVVIQTYNMEKDFLSFNSLLNEEQRSWITVQMMAYSVKPIKSFDLSSMSSVRKLNLMISRHRYFDAFIMSCIILNTIVMALVWFDQTQMQEQVIEIINYVFATIFTMEAIIKIIAFKAQYFHESWNIFDFTIVAVTGIFLTLKIFQIPLGVGSGATILRALRIGRVFRLAKKAEKLQIIFQTLVDSAVSLSSLGLLVIIALFMFAIIGRQMFGQAKIGYPNEELNEHANFRDFFDSFLILMRCSTGESWHLIMFELAKTYSSTYQCREIEDYQSIMENDGEAFKCGSPLVAYGFFIFYQILLSQILINLFIAIIVDGFLGNAVHFQLPVQPYAIYEFVSIWSKYDLQATGFIDIQDLDPFLKELAQSKEGKELVIMHEKVADSQHIRAQFITMLQIPTYNQLHKVMFYDTLMQLADKKNFVEFNKHKIQKDKLMGKEQLWFRTVDELKIIMDSEKGGNKDALDFDEVKRDLGKMNPKIKLMNELSKGFKAVHDKYAIYVDTDSNIHLTDEQRRKMDSEAIRSISFENAKFEDDLNVYTTKHHHYGTYIARMFKARQVRNTTIRQNSLSSKGNLERTTQKVDVPSSSDSVMKLENRNDSITSSGLAYMNLANKMQPQPPQPKNISTQPDRTISRNEAGTVLRSNDSQNVVEKEIYERSIGKHSSSKVQIITISQKGEDAEDQTNY